MESKKTQHKAFNPTAKEQVFEARIHEIDAMSKLIDMPSNNILHKKQFPKHMRRRSMSHNSKRIPKRLREDHINMREKSGISETPIKRPRRKYRRRPGNLLNDYNRRQKEFVWIETHLWHAKRFHIKKKWGYSIPYSPNDKCYRACYRASSKYCLIQDISYFCCIELLGKLDELLNGLNAHTSSECGLTFNSPHTQSGCYEGSVFFYESNKYPNGAIGEITFFWEPKLHSEQEKRKLWVWCHPSIYYKVVNELTTTFSLKLETNVSNGEEQNMNNSKNIEMEKLKLRNIPCWKAPKLCSEITSVEMILLKDTLNRFRLIGPKSQELLTKAFKPVDFRKRSISDWSRRYFNEGNENICNIQYEFWQTIKNITHPGHIPSHLIVSAIVIDPRFTLPSRGMHMEDNVTNLNSQSLLYENIPRELCYSLLWSSKIRDEITMTKISSHKLNELRSEKVVSGLEVELEHSDDHPAIPILLIQTPGANNNLKPLGYGAGWDVIVPCGYGLPAWMALYFQRGRPGGFQEFSNVCREAGKLIFPPDTSAGELEKEEKRREDTEKYFALPPAKRPNYIKLGFPNPFYCPWKILIKDWSASETFFVIRNLKKLNYIRNMINGLRGVAAFDRKDNEALVPVIVTLKGKGTLLENAHICAPNSEDLIELERNSHFNGPVESQHEDVLATKRNNIRTDHKALLKSLKRQRRKDKKRGSISDSHSSTAIVAEHDGAMREHWLPKFATIKDFCSRTVIGFVTDGDFSLTSSKSSGVGYVALPGLLSLINTINNSNKKKACFVLVRSRNTNQYWFASLNVAW